MSKSKVFGASVVISILAIGALAYTRMEARRVSRPLATCERWGTNVTINDPHRMECKFCQAKIEDIYIRWGTVEIHFNCKSFLFADQKEPDWPFKWDRSDNCKAAKSGDDGEPPPTFEDVGIGDIDKKPGEVCVFCGAPPDRTILQFTNDYDDAYECGSRTQVNEISGRWGWNQSDGCKESILSNAKTYTIDGGTVEVVPRPTVVYADPGDVLVQDEATPAVGEHPCEWVTRDSDWHFCRFCHSGFKQGLSGAVLLHAEYTCGTQLYQDDDNPGCVKFSGGCAGDAP